jgi:hypothetical protein
VALFRLRPRQSAGPRLLAAQFLAHRTPGKLIAIRSGIGHVRAVLFQVERTRAGQLVCAGAEGS